MHTAPQCPGYFGSDNLAAIHPQILDAIAQANEGYAPAYGADSLSKAVDVRFSELFERPCRVMLVATGTAANTLALGALCPPHGAILCHREAHIANDECTAPEFFTGGARLLTVDGPGAKPDPEALHRRFDQATLNGVHGVVPRVLSLTNATELGTVYTPEELQRHAAWCRERGLALHVDGARFANALVHCGATPAELSWKSGVDVLSFGATKNGAMAAEAAVFFDPALADGIDFRRKRNAQLWSKHRYLAAQFDGYFRNDLWLDLASHANAMASRLEQGLRRIEGIRFVTPVQANELFPIMPAVVSERLSEDGFVFYPWPVEEGMIRLVTSYQTTVEEVDRLLERARIHAAG